MKTTKFAMLLMLSGGLFFASCKEKDSLGDVTVSVDYWSDQQAVSMDTIMYENAAGNPYSVTHLQYYISNFTLHSADLESFLLQDIVLMDIEKNTTLNLLDVPIGTYNSVSLTLGLDNAHNTSGSLPNTLENNAMAWPDMMGGGYHFMKFEGYFRDNLQVQQGFAVHLGKTGNHVNCTFPISLVVDGEGADLSLKMNLNEWFEHPQIFDFNIDGSSIMADTVALQKIAANGVDVMGEK